jgi:hypothetical protein
LSTPQKALKILAGQALQISDMGVLIWNIQINNKPMAYVGSVVENLFFMVKEF